MSKNRSLRNIANQLPPIPKKDKGGNIMAAVIIQKSGVRYEPIYVDHFKELQKAFDKHGIAGVDAYIQNVKDFYSKITKELKIEQAMHDAEIAEAEVIQ